MSARVVELVGEVAREVQDRLPELTPRMVEMFTEVIPEFRHDPAVRRMMVASTASNLEAIIDVLALGVAPEDISVPPAAARYARRFAEHDMSLEALLRAYRLGVPMMLEWFIDVIEARDLPTGEALAVTRRVSASTSGYIDQVIEQLIEIYEQERQRWAQRSDGVRAARVQTVLTTDGLDTFAAEDLLGVSLRGRLTAAVCWTTEAADESSPRVLGRLLTEVTGRAPLIVRPDSATVWAWLQHPATPTVDVAALTERMAAHPRLRIALGEPGIGVAGFRDSHAEAVRARQVAELGEHPDRQVHQHAPVALAGLLAGRRDVVRVWVRRTLGELAADDESMLRLRETLRTFFATNGSYNDAAARMHVHKNTVLYRVRKAEEILGRPVTEQRLAIEVALEVCDRLALATPSPADLP
jgi:DNA-binding PucR family transcriptional regulator